MAEEDMYRILLCYAQPDDVCLITLEIRAGATLAEAIEASGILARFPEIDLGRNKVGIFGKLRPAETPVRDGDRIEIYRPLIADPKESRRRRAQHKSRIARRG